MLSLLEGRIVCSLFLLGFLFLRPGVHLTPEWNIIIFLNYDNDDDDDDGWVGGLHAIKLLMATYYKKTKQCGLTFFYTTAI